MTRAENRTFDLTYRPESYWDAPERIQANIKGEYRRRQIAEAQHEGTLACLPPEVFADAVSCEEWGSQGRIDPSRMGGETLPDYAEDEVEIARVSFPLSVLGDVYSVRARRQEGLIHYQVVDDYSDGEIEFHFEPATSKEPLTFGELIHLLENTYEEDGESGTLFRVKWRWDYENHGMAPEECTEQIELSSPYYPELSRWYEQEAASWRRARHAERAEEEESADPDDSWKAVAPELQRLAEATAERVRALGYREPLFTPEAAAAYVRHGHLERAAAAFSALCAKPVPPAEYAHLGPLDPKLFDHGYAPTSYVRAPTRGPLQHVADCPELRELLFQELPGVVHAVAEATKPNEGLPPLRPTEVEIARVRLGEEPDGLLSLRAAPGPEAVAYRLVDAADSRLRLPVESSERPLDLAGVTRLLDGAWDAGSEGTDTPETTACGIGAVFSNWEEELDNGSSFEEARRYVVVSSIFYPMLPRWYEAAAPLWLRNYEQEK